MKAKSNYVYYLWVVEMFNNNLGEWEPTVGAMLCREDAREELIKWRHRNPCDKLRISKYFREQS